MTREKPLLVAPKQKDHWAIQKEQTGFKNSITTFISKDLRPYLVKKRGFRAHWSQDNKFKTEAKKLVKEACWTGLLCDTWACIATDTYVSLINVSEALLLNITD